MHYIIGKDSEHVLQQESLSDLSKLTPPVSKVQFNFIATIDRRINNVINPN